MGVGRSSTLVGLCAFLLGIATGCTAKAPAISSQGLSAETASFDLYVGKNERLIFGVSDTEGRPLTGGTVQIRMKLQGTDAWSAPKPATSIGVPGRPQPVGDIAKLTNPSEAVGVYALRTDLPHDGFWEVEIDAGHLGKALTAFEVHASPVAVAVGSHAPASDNPVIATPGVLPSQLDSLALGATDISALTDPGLHKVSVARALADHRPFVVVVATPAFCTSQFCGPLVDEIVKLQPNYPGVDFIHLEVYPDGYERAPGLAASQWIAEGGVPTGQGNEPWLFVVDASGIVTQRWDNVVDLPALKTELTRIE